MREKTMNESLRLKTNTEQLQETLINTLQSQLEDRAYIIDALRKQLSVSAPVISETTISDLKDGIDVLEYQLDTLNDDYNELALVKSLQVENIIQLTSEAKQHALDMTVLCERNNRQTAIIRDLDVRLG